MTCLTPLPRASRKQLTSFHAVTLIVSCVLSLAACFPALAQQAQVLPECEGPAALQKELNAQLNSNEFENMKSAEQIAAKLKTIDEFIAKYPREAEPYRKRIDLSWTWHLKELRGKAVLINVWATWCAPCRAKLPHVQKLYNQLRDRTDVVVLSLNIDEDLGNVEPFLKEKGYGFPVLPAYGFVSNVLDSSVGIPHVNSKGQWQWTQLGFGSVDNWEEAVTNKLKAAEAVN